MENIDKKLRGLLMSERKNISMNAGLVPAILRARICEADIENIYTEEGAEKMLQGLVDLYQEIVILPKNLDLYGGKERFVAGDMAHLIANLCEIMGREESAGNWRKRTYNI
ncbi:MAG: hypothetical protein KAT77_01180 [Nanoarchaeota archaeon]|nr:hypothetical protein [Nanoarchaeota archaeon]